MGHVAELGYFSLSDLESLKGPVGLPVERDDSCTHSRGSPDTVGASETWARLKKARFGTVLCTSLYLCTAMTLIQCHYITTITKHLNDLIPSRILDTVNRFLGVMERTLTQIDERRLQGIFDDANPETRHLWACLATASLPARTGGSRC